ncbi:MAG: hypothetical protein GYB66_00300 [Chloroflexi bacterium]|nr:hypothetical protein [Chloroflexota bacterium]
MELVVTTDVGPRIIRFAYNGGPNIFKEYSAMLGQTGGDEWRPYGGHRLWHAPEDLVRTYYPDNQSVEFEEHANFVRLIQTVEDATGIQKEIDIALAVAEAKVTVTHRLRNTGLWPVRLAPWALSVMETGGVAVLPLPPYIPHGSAVLPAAGLVLWSYTRLADPRWTFGDRFILLRQDPAATVPQKIGIQAPINWAAYVHESAGVMLKRFDVMPGTEYPDYGAVAEIFTDPDMLEVETLGPLVSLAPAATVEHVETWYLFDAVALPRSDHEVERTLLPLFEAVL